MSTKTDDLLQAILDAQGPVGYARLAEYHESAMTTAAVAGVVVRPTTAALIRIYNGERVGGKSLVMDRLFCFQLVSAAAASYYTMWYCLGHPPINVAEPTNEIVTLRGTGDGRSADNGTVHVEVDATVVDEGWFPCGGAGPVEATGVLPGGGTEWECHGRLLVPPRHCLSMHVSASSVNEDFTVGASWWRMQV